MKGRKSRKALFSIIKDWSESKLSLPKIIAKSASVIQGSSNKNPTGSNVHSQKSKAGNTHNASSGGITNSSGFKGGTAGSLNKGSASSSGRNTSGSAYSSSSGAKSTGGGKGHKFSSSNSKVIIKANYIRGTGRISLHLKYIEHRQYTERSELFGKERDNLDRLWFTDKLGKYDNVHRIVISPADKDIDLKELTREVMKDFEKKKDRDLIWIAAIHKDPKHTSHPHVHLVVSGTDVKKRKLRIERPDIQFLKEKSSKFVEREKSFLSAIEKALDFDTVPKKEKNKEQEMGL